MVFSIDVRQRITRAVELVCPRCGLDRSGVEVVPVRWVCAFGQPVVPLGARVGGRVRRVWAHVGPRRPRRSDDRPAVDVVAGGNVRRTRPRRARHQRCRCRTIVRADRAPGGVLRRGRCLIRCSGGRTHGRRSTGVSPSDRMRADRVRQAGVPSACGNGRLDQRADHAAAARHTRPDRLRSPDGRTAHQRRARRRGDSWPDAPVDHAGRRTAAGSPAGWTGYGRAS